MKYLALVFFVATSAFPCLAQNSQTFRACNEKAKTQTEMNACASHELAGVEAQMDEVYNTLLSKKRRSTRSLGKNRSRPKDLARLPRRVHHHVPGKNKQAEYRSMYPMKVSLLCAKLTQKQVAALKELLSKSTD